MSWNEYQDPTELNSSTLSTFTRHQFEEIVAGNEMLPLPQPRNTLGWQPARLPCWPPRRHFLNKESFTANETPDGRNNGWKGGGRKGDEGVPWNGRGGTL